jgi:pimeloyl-ACP methyl ester carboxylesterase
LLHGSNASLHTWEPLVARLGRDYRIITYDARGHGLTGAVKSGDYRLDAMVADAEWVRAQLGIDKMILGGNSMGGAVAWRYAIAHPDRINALILLDAAGMPPRAGEEAPASNVGFRVMRYRMGRWLAGQITPRFMIEKSLRGSVSNQSIVNEPMIDRYWELLRFPGTREATGLRFSQRRDDQATAERAREITAPTLILFGKEDRLINASAAQSFQERIKGSEVVLLDGIGHLPMEEAPDATANAIRDFLTRRLSN